MTQIRQEIWHGQHARMTFRGNNRYVQYSSCSHIRLPESHRTSCEEACLHSDIQALLVREMRLMQTFLAQVALSNRAPEVQNLLNQTLNGSSQAVIRLANSGTRSSLSSVSVRVHISAATRPPAEVPDITRGRRPTSRKAFTTPKWSGTEG